MRILTYNGQIYLNKSLIFITCSNYNLLLSCSKLLIAIWEFTEDLDLASNYLFNCSPLWMNLSHLDRKISDYNLISGSRSLYFMIVGYLKISVPLNKSNKAAFTYFLAEKVLRKPSMVGKCSYLRWLLAANTSYNSITLRTLEIILISSL